MELFAGQMLKLLKALPHSKKAGGDKIQGLWTHNLSENLEHVLPLINILSGKYDAIIQGHQSS